MKNNDSFHKEKNPAGYGEAFFIIERTNCLTMPTVELQLLFPMFQLRQMRIEHLATVSIRSFVGIGHMS